MSMFFFVCYLRKDTWKFPCNFLVICVKVHGNFYVHGNFRVPFHVIYVKLGTWKFPSTFWRVSV